MTRRIAIESIVGWLKLKARRTRHHPVGVKYPSVGLDTCSVHCLSIHCDSTWPAISHLRKHKSAKFRACIDGLYVRSKSSKKNLFCAKCWRFAPHGHIPSKQTCSQVKKSEYTSIFERAGVRRLCRSVNRRELLREDSARATDSGRWESVPDDDGRAREALRHGALEAVDQAHDPLCRWRRTARRRWGWG